ncbi:MAG: cupin domain-containing protein [Chloroflexota bacterium]
MNLNDSAQLKRIASFKCVGMTAPTPREMRLGRGSVRDLVGPADGAQNVDCHVNVLNADAGLGPRHFHEKADNVYVVLSGAIEVEIDGMIWRVSAGEVAFIPPGVTHATGPADDAQATMLEIYAPPGSDFHLATGEQH